MARPRAEGRRDTTTLKQVDIMPVKEHSTYRQQPISVTSINMKDIQTFQIRSLKHINHLVPNFFMPDYGSRITSSIYIRGIGSRINTPSVGLYVDDVPYNEKAAFDFNLYDVDRIEVLRGPQGTLYGRNTMGGLIKIRTRSPLSYQGTILDLGYATHDHHRRASLSKYHHPTEHFAFSANAYYEGSSGFFKNSVTEKNIDNMESGGGRMRGIWIGSDRWSIDAQAGYDFNKQGGYPYFYEGALDPEQEAHASQIGHIGQDSPSTYRRSMWNASANVGYKAKGMTLNMVTAYQNLRDKLILDQDFLPEDIYVLTQKQRSHILTEEITLKSTRQGRWNWVSGAEFIYQALNTNGPVDFLEGGRSWLQQNINSTLPDLSAQGLGPMQITLNDPTITTGGNFDTPLLNLALFHQSSVALTEALKLSLGLRLDYEHNHIKYHAPAEIGYDFTLESRFAPVRLTNLKAEPDFLGSMSRDYWQIHPKVALTYRLSPQNSIYTTISRGARSGGYNIQMFNDLLQAQMRTEMSSGIMQGTTEYLNRLVSQGMPQAIVDRILSQMQNQMPIPETPDVSRTIAYKPEYSWNYEVGTHLGSANGKWQADAAAYLIQTRDQQISRFSETGLGRMMVNAGKSRSMGVEFSGRGQLTRNLALSANYGYCHAKFLKYDGGADEDYTGNMVPFSPRHTVGADASYTFYLNNEYVRNIQLGATYSGAGKIYWAESNTASQPFYSLLSARVSLVTKWIEMEVWGHNLSNTKYKTFYFQSMGRGFSQHGKPLQIGIDLRYRF